MVWLKIFIIFGLLLFIKIGPKFIGEIFGIEDFGTGLNMNFFKKLKEIPVVGKAASTVGGATTGAIGGAVSGFKSGGLKGAAVGAASGAAKGGIKGANKVGLMGTETQSSSGLSSILSNKVESIETKKELTSKNMLKSALSGGKIISKLGSNPSKLDIENAINEGATDPKIVSSLNSMNINQKHHQAAGELLSAKKEFKSVEKERTILAQQERYEKSKIETLQSEISLKQDQINNTQVEEYINLENKLSGMDKSNPEYNDISLAINNYDESIKDFVSTRNELSDLLKTNKLTNERLNNLDTLQRNIKDVLKEKSDNVKMVEAKVSIEQAQALEKVVNEALSGV